MTSLWSRDYHLSKRVEMGISGSGDVQAEIIMIMNGSNSDFLLVDPF